MKCEDTDNFATCDAANIGMTNHRACCPDNNTRTVGACTIQRELNTWCILIYGSKKLACTDKVEEDGDEDDTFPVYGIVLIAVFGGLVVSGVIYYVIGKLQQSGTKAPEQSKRELGQTLIF